MGGRGLHPKCCSDDVSTFPVLNISHRTCILSEGILEGLRSIVV